MFRPRSTMSTSFFSTLNTAPKQTVAATAAVVAASSGGERLICSGRTPNAQISSSESSRDRILKMCRLLENRKRRALCNEEAQALTDRIESILYKSSANGTDALDRVKSILAERQQHRQQRKKLSKASATNNTDEKQMSLLEDILGTKRMTEIEQLVAEINNIRSGTSWAGIIRASRTLNRSAGTSTSLARKMPKEVGAIYFHTRLMSAYAHIKNQASNPSFDARRVNMYNWSELIDEAKTNMAAYHALEDNHKSIIAETPVVCMGGLCSRVESSPRAA